MKVAESEKTKTPVRPGEIRARQEWLAVLADADLDDLEESWARLGINPEYFFLRRPEVGLVMVRARAGATGRRFNLGEATVTRCTVALAGGERDRNLYS